MEAFSAAQLIFGRSGAVAMASRERTMLIRGPGSGSTFGVTMTKFSHGTSPGTNARAALYPHQLVDRPAAVGGIAAGGGEGGGWGLGAAELLVSEDAA